MADPRLSTDLPDRSKPIWGRPSDAADRWRDGPPAKADVVVIGAGIVGAAHAARLAERGVDVALVDMADVGAGATGHSSAKVSVLHDCATAAIADLRGTDVAATYVDANRFGFDWIADRVAQRSIDCDWEVRPAISYTVGNDVDDVGREAELLSSFGLPAEMVDPGLPFTTTAAVRVESQAQFDPVPFVHDLADDVQDRGGKVSRSVRAFGIEDSGDGVVVHTSAGDISARWLVAATGLPFLDRGLFFARCPPESSYVVACAVESPPPPGMYLSHDGPKRSMRTAHGPDGEEVLLVGGEPHTTGRGGDTVARYRALVEWADTHFGVREVTHRFMTEDFKTPDQVPYVGPLHPGPTSVLVATGMNKWGFTNAVAAAETNVATITGDDAPVWAEHWTSNRVPREGLKTLASANAEVAAHLVGGWVGAAAQRPRPGRGEGRVRRRGLQPVAVSVDDSGVECSVSGVCPHLGAILTWNPAERTWDCPLHGSRFAADGTLVHGPAVEDLEQK